MTRKVGKPNKQIPTLVGETFEICDLIFEAIPAVKHILSLDPEDRCKDCDIWRSKYSKSCGLLVCRTEDNVPLIWRLINNDLSSTDHKG